MLRHNRGCGTWGHRAMQEAGSKAGDAPTPCGKTARDGREEPSAAAGEGPVSIPAGHGAASTRASEEAVPAPAGDGTVPAPVAESLETTRSEPMFVVPAVSGDDCVRALLACGCGLHGFVGRVWMLERDGRTFAVPRHYVLDAEVLLVALKRAGVPYPVFVRTLQQLDLLRGGATRKSRPPAPVGPPAGGDDEAWTLVSGDELADALCALGWLRWERTPLVSRLSRRGQRLIVPRDRVLGRDLVSWLLRRAR